MCHKKQNLENILKLMKPKKVKGGINISQKKVYVKKNMLN